MRIQTVKSNPNKMRRMNNGGRWMYKEGKKKPSKTLAAIARLHFFLTPKVEVLKDSPSGSV